MTAAMTCAPPVPAPEDADQARDDSVLTDVIARARRGEPQAWNALVERYSPLISSICRRHRLGQADAEDVSQSVWLRVVAQLDKLREPAALPGWIATTTRRECGRAVLAARGRHAIIYALDADNVPDEQAEEAGQELLAAERRAALHAALTDLPGAWQQLVTALTTDPPAPYAEVSARLGIPVGSIGPTRSRCLDRLRRYPAIAALIDTESGSQVASCAGNVVRPRRRRGRMTHQ